MKDLVTLVWRFLCDPGFAIDVDARKPHPLCLQRTLEMAQSLSLLLARLYVAQVFFLSGLTKIRDWSVTLALFQDEYQVPLLPPEWAAYAGTAGELALPVLLALGLGGRFAALGLSVVNAVAVLSLAEIAPAALAGHQLWGALLLMVALWGSGRISLDALIRSRTA
jgi:putative oxidoreductase